MEKFAVIDLGSNTFHLLIAQLEPNQHFSTLYRKRVYARLARTGIGTISDDSFQEGLLILQEFKTLIDQYQVQKVKVVGTEMLRLSPNGADFVQQVYERTGLVIDVISGHQEAEYIYMGVKQLHPDSSYLIMDIGGGSVEFILVKNGQKTWMKSMPIGIAVLYFRFHLSDPISDQELKELRAFLAKETSELAQVLKEESIEELIGASGVFETFFQVLGASSDQAIDAQVIRKRLEKLIKSSLAERLEMDNIPKMRKKMIIVASVLLEYALKLTFVKIMRYSPNSLKEGLLYSFIQEDKL